MRFKDINDKSDLAINGAPPAFSEALHVGKPNVYNRSGFLSRVEEILDSNWLTNDGPMVQELEQKIADRLNVKHCVAMCNGTTALEVAIRALGLTGEVIVPAWTFVATAHALYWQGITPVFADIDPLTHNLDPASVKKMINPRTSGIIGVHLWGRASPIDELQEIADKYRIKLFFDAAHAFDSVYKGEKIGRFGECEVFSFHATKAFNTMEGGAITTDDDKLAEIIRLMRNFGFSGYDNVIYPGINGKMTEVSAAMGLANLSCFDSIIEHNYNIYNSYRLELFDINGIELLSYKNKESNFHYIVVEVKENCSVSRDVIVSALHAENILARKYFWPGVHNMHPYNKMLDTPRCNLLETDKLSNKIIVLPNGAGVTELDVKLICSVIRMLVNE